jgi:hypothetical protein
LNRFLAAFEAKQVFYLKEIARNVDRSGQETSSALLIPVVNETNQQQRLAFAGNRLHGVLRTLVPFEREIEAQSGLWYTRGSPA